MSAMDRRGALGLLAGAGLGAAGCGGLPGLPGIGPDVPDMDRVLGDLDGMMKAIQTVPVRSLEPKLAGRPEPARKEAERIIRSILRSLVLVGTFRDLPVEAQVHPGMQERMRLSLPELDAAVTGSRDVLLSFTEDDKKTLGQAMKKDPDFLMRLVGDIDEEATAAGIPLGNRIAMRRIAQHVSTRLKQSSALYLDETLTRTDRLRAQAESGRFDQQVLSAKATEEALWKRQQWMARADRLWASAGAVMNPVPAGVYGTMGPDLDEKERRKGKVGIQFLTAGWSLFGLSFSMNGLGIALIVYFNGGIGAALFGGFPITHGVVMLILGIAMVVAGYDKIAAARAAGVEP
jgi:hypothetical protein